MSGVLHGVTAAFVSSVVALLKGEGSNNSTTITDHSLIGAAWTVGGNARISTAQFKYGSASIYFDGTNDYITATAAPANFTFSTGDFTVEFWLWSGTLGPQNGFIAFDTRGPGDGTNKVTIIYSDNNIRLEVNENSRIAGGALALNTWHHIALSRAAGVSRLFVNGTQVGSSYTDTFNYSCATNRPIMGGDGPGGGSVWNLNGYIDDVRITRAARYTSNFTPPGAL